jgi:hypothetical protein
MAGKFCTQCGFQIAEGKRFCGKCGKAIQAPKVERKSDTGAATMAAPAGKVCTQCGSPVAAGKRFCIRCGKPVAEAESYATPGARAVQPTTGPAPLPAIALGQPAPLPEAERRESKAKGSSGSDEGIDSNQVPAPKWTYEQDLAPIPEAQRASDSSESDVNIATHTETDEKKSSARIRLLAATVVALITIAAAGAWFYVTHIKRANTSASIVQSLPAQSAGAPSASAALATKPSPATTAVAPATTAPAPARTATDEQGTLPANTSGPQPHLAVPLQSPGSSTPNQLAAQPSPPSLSSSPATPSSGMLHYTGPPIHYGEVVIFAHLPGGRLRFVFDHQSWQPLISRQSDGSQTLTLRSLKHTDQTQCDVQWATAQ